MEMEKKRCQHVRQWDALPSPALVSIFRRTSIKDRMFSLPLVCKSWSHASRYPHCWASMVAADADADADAFLEDSYPYQESLVDPFDGRRSSGGVQAFQALIGRASGGAAITSLYFFPFLNSPDVSPNDDALLHLIAHHCPNLKHLSFHGSRGASEQAILQVIHSCKKLEIVDFSDSPYFIPSILGNMGSCCPSVRGIRRNGEIQPSFASQLAACFPSLKLLNLSDSTLVDKDLLSIVTSFRELEYLDIRRCQRLLCYMYIVKCASASRLEIIYD